MKSCSKVAIIADSRSDLDDEHILFTVGQWRSERERRRQRARERLRHAVQLAEASVWSDRKMLGLPHIRWRVVESAAHHALSGLDRPPIMDLHGIAQADVEIVMTALLNAVDAVRESMDCSPENLHD